MCLSITGNTASAGQLNGADKEPGIILDKATTIATTYKFEIVGLTPSPATEAQTETYVAGINTSETGAGTYAGKKVHPPSASDDFTSCTLPTGM